MVHMPDLPVSLEQAFGNATLALSPSTHIRFFEDYDIRAFAPTSVQVFNDPGRMYSKQWRHTQLQLEVESIFGRDFKNQHPLHGNFRNDRVEQYLFEVPSQLTICDVKSGHTVFDKRFTPQRNFHCAPVLTRNTMVSAQKMVKHLANHDTREQFVEKPLIDFFLQMDRESGLYIPRRNMFHLDPRHMLTNTVFNTHNTGGKFSSLYMDASCPYGRFGVMYGLNFLVENGRTYNDIEKVYKAANQCACEGMEIVHKEQRDGEKPQLSLVWSMRDLMAFGVSQKKSRNIWLSVSDMLPVKFAMMFPRAFLDGDEPRLDQIRECVSNTNGFTLAQAWKCMTNTKAHDASYLSQAGTPKFDVQCLREVYLLAIAWYRRWQNKLHEKVHFIHYGERYLRYLAELFHNPVTGGPRIGGFHSSDKDTAVREHVRFNAARLLHREVCLEREPCGWKALENADQFYLNAIDIANQRAWAMHTKFCDERLNIGWNPHPQFYRRPNLPPQDKYMDEELLEIHYDAPDAVDLTGFDESHFSRYSPYVLPEEESCH